MLYYWRLFHALIRTNPCDSMTHSCTLAASLAAPAHSLDNGKISRKAGTPPLGVKLQTSTPTGVLMQTLQLWSSRASQKLLTSPQKKELLSVSRSLNFNIQQEPFNKRIKALSQSYILYIFFLPFPLLCSAMRHTCCSLPSLTRKSSKNYLDTCSTTNKIGTAITKIKLLLTSRT